MSNVQSHSSDFGHWTLDFGLHGEAMNDYDFYLRDPGIRGGEWVGFPLAWKGLGGVGGLPLRPHRSWQPWVLDPSSPDDPTAGHWGVLQWRYNIAVIEGLGGLQGV